MILSESVGSPFRFSSMFKEGDGEEACAVLHAEVPVEGAEVPVEVRMVLGGEPAFKVQEGAERQGQQAVHVLEEHVEALRSQAQLILEGKPDRRRKPPVGFGD